MAAKRGSRRRQPDGATMSGVFLDIGPDQSEAIIVRALAHRQDASESVRSSLNASIDNNVKMEGFRHPSRANAGLIKDSALYHLIAKSNDKLAGALLRAWVESHPDLRETVESGLRTLGESPDAPDFKVGRFNSKWDAQEWRSAKEAVIAANGDVDADEAALMIMCVSGKSGETAAALDVIESELFLDVIERMDELPPDAPEWDETTAFIEAVADVASRKRDALRDFEVNSINETAAAIKGEFNEELRYLEIDLSAWTGENAVERNAASAAKKLAGELREKLAEYRPLRPQAASRAEESERGPMRADAEKAVIDLVAKWGALESDNGDGDARGSKARAAIELPEPGSKMFAEMMRLRKMRTEINDIRKATDELSSDQSKEDVGHILRDQKTMKAQIERLESDNSDLKRTHADLQSLYDGIVDENAGLKQANAALSAEKAEREAVDVSALEAEVERLQADNRRLAEDKEGLERDKDGLRFDMERLGLEKDELRDELTRSGDSETYWREAYIAVSAGQTRAATGASPDSDPTSVNEALEMAQSMFPNELAIALNSKSSKNSPFRKPEEVLAALAWLATEYRRRRLNSAPGAPRPDFNWLLKESCPGWFYKPGQTEVTAEQFSEWYTTTVDNKTYDLRHHIGKGNSYDPQHTIRIAFGWDDVGQRVAVGFLGLHQRNRRT